MRHYRSLFDELVEPVADQPLARDTEAGATAVDEHEPVDDRVERPASRG
jgi:hypothetical protein